MRLTRDVLSAVVLVLAAVGAASAANSKASASAAQHRKDAKATERLSKSRSVTFAPGHLTLGATLPANPALELSHGYELLQDLDISTAATEGTVPDIYRISQKPFSSYEALVDSTSGDIGPVQLELIANDGTTVLATSVPVGAGFSRSLRFMNDTANPIDDQTVRVQSGDCNTDCGPDDVYFIRGYETTYSVPRFNNSGTQITILLLQNPTNYTIGGTVYFWNTGGTQVANLPFTLSAKQVAVVNTSITAPGVAGALTIVHDGRYGDLSAKTVALEPATGFSFDSPALPRVNLTGRNHQ